VDVYVFDLLAWPHLEAPSRYPDPNSLFDPELGAELYREHVALLTACEDYGFDAVCINEHHAKPYGLMPSPNLIAAALTQLTSRIKIGIIGNLIALHASPIRLAEEIAMLSYHRGVEDLVAAGSRPPPSGLPFYEYDFDQTQREGITFVGDPEYVADAIAAQMDEVGAGTLMGLFQFGSMAYDVARRNVETFAARVLPRLKR
jgi:alkanesulfonate monooxygenase SsuD/methylene tetrahydromethanopterin reductase-like flavin-dependent oxidoreductase (luciferase family)